VTEPAGEGILGGETNIPLETKDTCQVRINFVQSLQFLIVFILTGHVCFKYLQNIRLKKQIPA